MGATNFEDYGFGKNADIAFNSCVRQAHYDQGHDCYNGTISTVQGYKVFDIPTSIKHERAAALVWALYEAADDDVRYSSDQIKIKQFRWSEGGGTPTKRWRTYRIPKGLTVSHLLDMVASIEKWESCCAIRVTGTAAQNKRKQHGWKGLHGDVYYFFGLAAC
jgi:hypothetical protein